MQDQKSEDLEKAKKNATLLYEVSRVISSSRYLDEILTLIVAITAQLTGSKICSMMLFNEKKDKLVIQATQSLSENYRKKPPIHLEGSICGKVVAQKIPVTVLNVTVDPNYQYPEIAKGEGLCSLSAIPMLIKDRVIGVLNCYTEEEHEFSTDELQILTGVANQAAMAIENTSLLADKVQAFEQLEVRKLMDRAKGILTEKNKLSEKEAYRFIQKQSMNKRKTLKEVAEAIILANDLSS